MKVYSHHNQGCNSHFSLIIILFLILIIILVLILILILDLILIINTLDQCEYIGPRLSNLKAHKAVRHSVKNAKYLCDQCEYCTTSKIGLGKHKPRKHADITYTCDICDCLTIRKDFLKRHTGRNMSVFDIHAPSVTMRQPRMEN